MLASRLHPLWRNRPDPRAKVDLTPSRAKYFARSRRGENGELEGQCGNRVTLPEPRNEGRNIGIGHSRMVAAGELLPLG